MKTFTVKNNVINITKLTTEINFLGNNRTVLVGFQVEINKEIYLIVKNGFIIDWNGNIENGLEDIGLSSGEVIDLVNDFSK